MVHDPHCEYYTVVGYAHDVRVWVANAVFYEHRQGRRFISCFGGSVRKILMV